MNRFHTQWTKVFTYIFIVAVIFFTSIFFLFDGMFIPIYCIEERLPDDNSLRNYLIQADIYILPTLRNHLMDIKDAKSATESIPKLIQLGATCSILYESSAVFQTVRSNDEFSSKIIRLIQQETTYKPNNKNMMDDVIREYKRLAIHNFYGCRILEDTLRFYFFEQAGDSVFSLWQPMGMIRYNLAVRDFSVTKESVKQLFSQLYNGIGIKDPHDDRISILFLDYYDRAQTNGRGDFKLIAPAKPTIRGQHAIFDNCLCLRFCFNRNDNSINFHSNSLEDMHPSELYSLNIENAKQLKEFVDEKRLNDEATSLIYRLEPPFLSTYLILNFDGNKQHCSSIMFSSEYP